MILCTIISYLICGFTHPILIIYGSQGSAKSTLFKFIRRLIDPSKIELIKLPPRNDEKELVQILNHHYFAAFDNISYISPEFSDIFCRGASGEGISKRELYTDDEDVVYNYQRCIGFNGINQAAERADILERSILIELLPIKKRRTDTEVDQKFEADRTEIFGGLLSILSEAMKIRPTIDSNSTHRLSDFHCWGRAITEALGSTRDEFNKKLDEKVESQIDETINADNVGLVFLEYFGRYFENNPKATWESSPTALFEVLTQEAEVLHINTKDRTRWPPDGPRLSNRINRLVPALTKKGFEITNYNGGRKGRSIIVRRGSQTQLGIYREDVNAVNDVNTVSINSSREGCSNVKGKVYENSVYSVDTVNISKFCYRFRRVSVGGMCVMCEQQVIEYVVYHTDITAGFVYRNNLCNGNEEHLCSSCFGRKRKSTQDAQWIDVTEEPEQTIGKTVTGNAGENEKIVSNEETSFVVTPINPPGEPCPLCNELAVERIIKTVKNDLEVKTERVCEGCFSQRKAEFPLAKWRFVNGGK
jgi:hypothetical protein